jgi:trigger factor
MDTIDQVLPMAYRAAVIEHALVPVADPELTDLKMDDDAPVILKLTVQVRPEVEPKDYENLELVQRSTELAPGAVDEALERLRDGRATWETVTRPAEVGDRLKGDITPMDDAGAPKEDETVKDYQFEVGAEGNFAAFDEALTGTSTGDVREITVTYPDDYAHDALRGRTATYRVTVGEIEAKVLPELDDAFASKLKDGQTLLELRTLLRDNLQKEAEQKAEQAGREEIVDKLVAANPVDLPPALVDDYLKQGVEEMRQRSAYMGRPLTDEAAARYMKDSRPYAERSLKGMLILEAIRRKESIRVDDEAINAKIEARAAEYGFPAEKYREYMKQGGELERLAHELADELTFDFLRSRAQFKDA